MSANRQPKRPGPAAYQHLWSLLAVFTVFLAAIVFAVVADDRPAQIMYSTDFLSQTSLDANTVRNDSIDASVPTAAGAMARLPGSAVELTPPF